MRKPTNKHLQEYLNKSYAETERLSKENHDLRDRLKLYASENESLRTDKNWLKQLCAEQSSTIASYMRSR
jgi:hypothetical protein